MSTVRMISQGAVCLAKDLDYGVFFRFETSNDLWLKTRRGAVRLSDGESVDIAPNALSKAYPLVTGDKFEVTVT